MMDVGVLRDRIRTTLDPNADARRQAELDLRYVSLAHFFSIRVAHTPTT